MRVRMTSNIGGYRNLEPWPPIGGIIDLPDHEARDLIVARHAVACDAAPEEELADDDQDADAAGDDDEAAAEDSEADAAGDDDETAAEDSDELSDQHPTVPTARRGKRS